MSGNPWAGEVELVIEGEARVMRLTLGALAELEAELGAGSLAELFARFEGGAMKARDVILILRAGLAGGGLRMRVQDVAQAEIEGGPLAAAAAAGRLIARAFAMPGGRDD